MLAQSKRYLLLLLIIVSAICTLISGFFLFALQNEYTLAEAMNSAQVRAEIRGMAEDGRFTQPMLEISLSKETFLPLTIVIPQGLILSSSSGESDLVIGRTEKRSLFRSEKNTTLLAYSLDYRKPFPNSGSEYQAKAALANQNLRRVLHNVAALKAEEEIASQLAVWAVYNDVKVEKISEALGIQSPLERVHQIKESHFRSVAPTSDSWLWWGRTRAEYLSTFFALLTLLLSTLFMLQLGKKNQPTTHKQRIDEPVKSEGLIDKLTDWDLLTEGQMAEIWTAVDNQSSNQKVVVKFPRTDSPTISQENIHFRFKRGIGHLQKITKPFRQTAEHVAQLIEFGQSIHPHDGHQTPYLIQEFVDGSTLHEILQERNYEILDPLSMTKIVDQILAALKHMHQKKVVYRNITLNNIMVDKTGQVYLVDFGNATQFDSTETADIGLPPVGTSPFYAPPDLIGNVPARDYYSLAMLIYAMYAGKSVIGLSEKEVKMDLEHLSQNGVPQSQRTILEWCLRASYQDTSAEIHPDFSTPRQILATMVEKAQDPPNRSNQPDVS